MPSKQPPSAVRSFTWRGALMPAPASVRSPSRLMPLIVLAACYAPCANAALVARWPLDEGQGDLFRDVVGDNDGFLPQDAEIEWVNDGPAGIQNASVLFSGDLGPSYIETPFPGIGGADPRTVTLWVKADPQPFNTAMVAWGSLENGRKWHFRINQGTNSLRTEFMGGQNFAETDMADGQWHFVASVFPEGATEGLEIEHYLDAQFDPQLGGTSRAIDTATGDDDGGFNVHIGWAAGHPNRFFVGQIADVRIYDEALDEERLAKIMAGEEIGPGVLGDFDGDGQLTVSDINTLAAALRTPNPEQRFDVNGDGSVTLADHAFWVETIKKTWIGDANLDGEFNTVDFLVVFQAGLYEDDLPGNSDWSTGDWNADGDFDSGDFIVAFQGGGFEKGPRPAAAVVPEPSTLLVPLLSLLAITVRRRSVAR